MLKTTLKSRGVIDEVKAKLRAEIFNALDDQVCLTVLAAVVPAVTVRRRVADCCKAPAVQLKPRVERADPRVLGVQWVQEYTQCIHARYPVVVHTLRPCQLSSHGPALRSETGQPKERPFTRDFIADQLRLPVAPGSRVPLLYSVLRTLEGGAGAGVRDSLATAASGGSWMQPDSGLVTAHDDDDDDEVGQNSDEEDVWDVTASFTRSRPTAVASRGAVPPLDPSAPVSMNRSVESPGLVTCTLLTRVSVRWVLCPQLQVGARNETTTRERVTDESACVVARSGCEAHWVLSQTAET